MKRFLILIFMLFLLAGCSNQNEATPNERFAEFTSYWKDKEFNKMYEMFSSETKLNITAEESVERQNKIYDDLQAEILDISFTELSDEDLKALAKEDKMTATLPFSVEMETFSGPIQFDYEAALVKETSEDEETNWYIEWNPGFIFPDLADGGKINIHTIQPKRGNIYDRNQVPLAINDTVYQMGIVPGELGDNREQAIQKFAAAANLNPDTINSALDAGWVEDHLFVPILTILPSNEEVYRELMDIPGVQRKEVEERIYPKGEAAAHLVGYIGNITEEILNDLDNKSEYGPNDKIGRRGIEQLYEGKLKGKRGAKILIQKDDGEEILLAEKPVENGEDITLTIDIDIQEKVYNSFADDSGTAAAIHPKTGETLALVSAPAFDPNEILYGTSGNTWTKLQEDEQNPLINRFAASFAPGSVIKPVTAAVGLKNGILDPDEEFEIEGLQWSKGEAWGNYAVTRVSLSRGPVNLQDAMERSDNIYFAMQAVEMGEDAFIKGFEEFGFGEELPYEYPITMSTISSSGELNDEVLLANSSYGQGELETSALYLAAAYTTFLNDGNMLKPTLLTSEDTGQIWKENLISEEHAHLLNNLLRSVVTNGTGKRAEEANVPIAGKTGTVELKLNTNVEGAENSWFVAYPFETPDILIAMLVENTEDKESGLAIGKFVEVINQLYP